MADGEDSPLLLRAVEWISEIKENVASTKTTVEAIAQGQSSQDSKLDDHEKRLVKIEGVLAVAADRAGAAAASSKFKGKLAVASISGLLGMIGGFFSHLLDKVWMH